MYQFLIIAYLFTLQKEIKILEESVNLDFFEIESKKAELEYLRKEKLQGVLVRSRMKRAEEGEKPTKYFCSLESRNYINKTILNITKDNGTTLNKQDEILKEVENFYKKLYSYQELEENINIEECLRKVETHIISTEEEKIKLEVEITGDEITFVLNNMKNNKSPGTDGFSSEFLNSFIKILNYLLGMQ